ncbi:MAG: diacylglycerol kinase [Candidatus Moraniibacteriota bacterium]
MKKIKEKLDYFVESFRYAARGLSYAWKSEQNFRSEVFISLLVLVMMLVFPLRPIEQVLVGLLITWVLTLELINTVLERMADIVKPRVHPYIKITKDLMAGAVLISAAGAAVIGIIIFYPYWANLLSYLLAW